MKKILLLAAAALMAAGSMQAKTADELRVYLNAGHGSWGPNDRPMATIPYPALAETGRPDTCGFYESNTNLWKILRMGEVLQNMGVKKENIMYSRVKNGPYPYVSGAADAEQYNRALSEIREECDANNMDVFVSIHSNAATEGTTTNYTLFLYRGQDYNANGFEQNEGSYELCKASWGPYYMDELDPHSYYSLTSTNIHGDWDFYGSTSTSTTAKGTFKGYLGVLRMGTPGYLVEGYFHTYQPARHRALNKDYCGQEGTRAARGICAYYNLNPEKTGYIMGTVKDIHNKIVNNLFKYAAGTNDQWLPLNGAVVKLMKDGNEVATYNVDNNYNGIFVFNNLAPGKYKVVATHADYKAMGEYTGTLSKDMTTLLEQSLGEIEVKANETSYAKLYLESNDYVPPTVAYKTYPDDVNTASINGIAPEITFNTLVDKKAATVLEGKTVRRSIFRGKYQYVLALDATDNAPHVYQIDPKTQEVVKTISTTGVQGSVLPLSDIAFTADGFLIGCNKEACAYTPSNSFRVYKWAEDLEGDPTEWFSSTLSGNWLNAIDGQSMAFSGSTKEGKLVTTAVTTASSGKIRFLIFNIENNAMATASRNQDNAFTEVVYGSDFTLQASPRSDDNFIIDGSAAPALEFGLNSTDAQAPTVLGTMSTDLVPVASNNASYFKYAGSSVMVVPNIVEGKMASIDMFDVTNGFNSASLIKTTAVAAASGSKKKIAVDSAEDAAFAAAGGQVEVEVDNDGNFVDANILVSALNNDKISLYTTENATQPIQRGDFAYDLNYEESADTYTFKFKTTRDAENVSIVLKPIDGSDPITISAGDAVTTGNTVTINKGDYPENKYNWEVVVPNKAISQVSRFFNYAPTGAGNSSGITRGVAIDTNPESPYFQNIYLSVPYGSQQGIYELTPGLESVNDGAPYFNSEWAASNSSSPFRMKVHPNGTVFIADWSDPHSGIYTFDPANTESVGQFFQGTRSSSGLFTLNGVQTGGSTTDVAFVGEDENLKLVTFNEDIDGGVLSVYNVGENMTTSTAPNATLPTVSAKMVNGNVAITARENGLWCSQTRSSGNNAAGVPSFVYADYDDNIIFNSANLDDLNGSWGSGLTVSDDNSTLAVSNDKAQIQIYDVTWNDNTPSLKLRYTIPQKFAIVNELMFDHAGNLFGSNTGSGIFAFAIPKDAQDVVTPAKMEMILNTVKTTGVDDVNTAKTVANVKYYNVMGVESSTPFDGINIVVTTYTDGTTSSAKVRK